MKQHPAAIRALCDWLVVHQVLPVNPAASVRGPRHVVTKSATSVLTPAETRALLERAAARVPGRAGDDQAGGGGGAARVDVLPHVSGTGIAAYLSNGGTLEQAQRIAGHASPKTTKLYDRTADTNLLDEIERIGDLGGDPTGGSGEGCPGL